MIMKKVFNSFFVIIAAMVTFAGCAKQEIDAPATVETKTVQFYAESIETKTAFGTPDGKIYPTLWTENDDAVKLSLNYASPKNAEVEVSNDFTTASFTAEITDDESGAYVFYAMSPASAYNNFHDTDKYLSANISTTQTPLANSVDEKAQVLYAVSEQFDEMPSSVSLNFKHFTAYGKLSFVNLNLDGATVTSVAIESSVDFAGRWNYMVETGEFQENSGSSEITLSTSNTENLWFACAPVDMNNQTLTFTVNTDKGPLSKTVTLTNKKFEAGKIATMKVDMEGIEFAESVVYELVTDPSELTVDSEIIIVASASDVALSTTQNNNNRGQAGVTKDGDTISDPGSAVQVITIEDGTKDGTVAFNVGNGYLYAASSGSNYLRTENTLSDNSSWLVTIAGGVATIKAQGTNTRNWLRYNSASANGQLFSCYASGQSDVSIYKRQGTGSAPLPKLAAPVVTAELNDDETGINVSWNSVANATSYVVSCDGQEDKIVEGTSCFFNDLSSGTYVITVKAQADGYKSATGSNSVVVPSASGEKAWTLVTDASTLKAGDKVIIVAKDSDVAMSTTQNSNNRGQVTVTKSDNVVTFTSSVQELTLVDGKKSGTFAFSTGSGYLYAASSSKNYLRTENSLSDNSSWTISIADTGIATVKAQGTNTRNLMQYNKSSSIFASYSSSQQSITIYRYQ